MGSWDKLFAEIEKVQARNAQDYQAVAQMAGRSVKEVEADLTAPDPRADEE